ncbi:MAG: hypothetical protein ACKVXR_08305 [Planctomycetota bacterium]
MGPHTDLIESAPGALLPGLASVAGQRQIPFGEGARAHRRVQDRGRLWVRITLLIVVSVLLLHVAGSSRARHAPVGHTASSGSPTSP